MDFCLVTALVAATVAHEGAHAAVAVARGLKVKGIVCNWRGIGVRRERGTDLDTVFIAAAGPLVNLALALCLPHWPNLHFANLVLCIVNMLPIPGSDGSKVFASIRKAVWA